jgi:hypothetical protein
MVSLDDVYSKIRGSHPTTPSSGIEAMAAAEENKIIDKYNTLVRESTKLKNSARTNYADYKTCPSKQQKIYESNIYKAEMSINQNDFD